VRTSEDMRIVVPRKGAGTAGIPVTAGVDFLGPLTFCNRLRNVTEVKFSLDFAEFKDHSANGPVPVRRTGDGPLRERW
jgi:hypothetical protein